MGTKRAETEEPAITLPTDKTRQWQLQEKLVEYGRRLHPYRAPERQMDLVCKIAVLKRLLRDSEVNISNLSREMAEKYGPGFNADDFNNARAVIKDYCETGGQNVRGGFGLATPPTMNSK